MLHGLIKTSWTLKKTALLVLEGNKILNVKNESEMGKSKQGVTGYFANELFCQRPVRQHIIADHSVVNLSKLVALYCNNVQQI